MTSPPVALRRGETQTFLKWHRGRRRASDPVFTGRRILEGMAAGASVEVDLVIHGGNGFAVLHDHLDVSRETTGLGPAKAFDAAAMRALYLRANDGTPSNEHVMLLEDLSALLAATPPHEDALLQLDFKEEQGPLSPEIVAAFARAVGPMARHCILSSGEAHSVRALSANVPELRIGHDPCHDEWVGRVRATGDFAGFVAHALAEAGRAEMIYLAYPLVLAAEEAGFDIIAAFHADGRRVDAYTIKVADATTRPVVERLLALGVDQITTDDPEGLFAMMGAAS